jgi:20S proteasome subunit beta 6
MAIAGNTFCVVAADTRMSNGYNVLSRDHSKTFKLTNSTVMATSGMAADRAAFQKLISAYITKYEHTHGHVISTQAIAQLVSTNLYYRRFFPFYTFNVIGGLDENGAGSVYGYDAIGSFERIPYCVQGSGSALATSILDNQIEFKTHPSNKRDLDVNETVALVKDVFTSIGERDIYTGDQVDIHVISADGILHEKFQLKRD